MRAVSLWLVIYKFLLHTVAQCYGGVALLHPACGCVSVMATAVSL